MSPPPALPPATAAACAPPAAAAACNDGASLDAASRPAGEVDAGRGDVPKPLPDAASRGDGLGGATAGEEAEFEVILRDELGNPLGSIEHTHYGPTTLVVELERSTSQSAGRRRRRGGRR